MGDVLRARLNDAGWRVVNETALPLVCFTHPDIEAGATSTKQLLERIYARGKVWISEVNLGAAAAARGPVLRACITSYLTTERDVATLLEEVNACLTAQDA